MATAWEAKYHQLSSKANSTYQTILDRQRAQGLNLDTKSYDATIHTNLESLKKGVDALEMELSQLESTSPGQNVVKSFEEKVLQLSKMIDKLEAMLKPSGHVGASAALFEGASVKSGSARKFGAAAANMGGQQNEVSVGLDNQGLLQLQDNIMTEQDRHLDVLSETIQRQKNIGMAITSELEHHIDLLEETDDHVDTLNNHIQGNQRRLDGVMRRVQSMSTSTIILALVVILFIVVFLAKKL